MYGGRSTGYRWISHTILTTRRAPPPAIVTAAFGIQPYLIVAPFPKNRLRLAFKKIEGDVVDPEWLIQGYMVGWLSNKAQVGFKKLST